MHSLFAILFFVWVLISSLAQAQTCYISSTKSSGLTQCQAPPFFNNVQFSSGPCSDYSYCTANVSNNGVSGDAFVQYTTNFNKIPKPLKYVQLLFHSDVQCLNQKRIEFLTDSPCGTETGFYATCNETHARVVRYFGGCGSSSKIDNTYPLNACAGGPDEFVVATCGTSASTPISASPPVRPPVTNTPYYYPPVTQRATPLTCYLNVSASSLVPYNFTDASIVCIRYSFVCPKNVTYCTEGAVILNFSSTSRETCQTLKRYPEIYPEVYCCDTNYCNGPGQNAPNVSGAVTTILPPLALAAYAIIMCFLGQ